MGGTLGNTLEAARHYHEQGYRPVPIPAKTKGPRVKDWPNYQFDAATSPRDFPIGSNIGIIMGGGLVCVDFDHERALVIAPQFLPATGCVIGRPGRPRCHWFYRLADGELLKNKSWKTKVDGKTVNLIDLLSDGKQVVVGPSVHPSGDIYEDLVGEPATVTADELMAAITALVSKARGDAPAEPVRNAGPEPAAAPVAAPVDGIEQSRYYFDADSVDNQDRPGDRYNAEHPGPLLIRHRWTQVKGGENELWLRPGDTDSDYSATLKNINGKWKLYVFSSNAAPLAQDRAYDPLGLLAAFEHGGSITAAVAALHAAESACLPNVDVSGIVSKFGTQSLPVPVDTGVAVVAMNTTGLAVVPLQPSRLEEDNEADIEVVEDELFPSECLEPPGFLGDLVRYNLSTAIFRQPVLALSAALAALSALTSRLVSYLPYSTYTNLYIVALAPSGGGKEHGRGINKDLFELAGLGDMLGEGIGSAPGIIAALVESKSFLIQADELADLLKVMIQAKGSAHIQQIAPLLKSLKTSAGKKWKSPLLRFEENRHTVIGPHLVVYGTSVVTDFYEALTPSQLADGLVSRFLIFDAARVRQTPCAEVGRAQLPIHLVELAKAWANLDTGHTDLARATSSCHAEMGKTAEALARLAEHSQAISDQQVLDDKSGETDRAALWSRTAEKASGLALLHACSRATLEQLKKGAPPPMVELADVEWAIRLADWQTRRVVKMATRFVGLSAWEGKLKKALAALGPKKRLVRAWRRKCKFFEKGEWDAALKELQNANFIVAESEKTSGRPRVWISRVGK